MMPPVHVISDIFSTVPPFRVKVYFAAHLFQYHRGRAFQVVVKPCWWREQYYAMSTLLIVAGENVARLEETQQEVSTLNIGTRKSNLALVQTDLVVNLLATAWPNYKYSIKARDTAAGDIDKSTPFKDMPVKNLWTHELETLMMDGNLDILVHALKGRDPPH